MISTKYSKVVLTQNRTFINIIAALEQMLESDITANKITNYNINLE